MTNEGKPITIYVDAIGGDTINVRERVGKYWYGVPKHRERAVSVAERTVEATKEFLDAYPEARVVLGGNSQELERKVGGIDRVTIVDGRPTTVGVEAIRRERRGTALYNGLEMLQRGECDAMYTSGNTQAVAMYVASKVGRFKGFKSMPLVARLPKKGDKPVYLLDVGATDSLSIDGFRDLALLGHAYCKAAGENPNPKLGLLSIGKEPGKGGPKITEVHDKLSETAGINYVGLVEPRGWMLGNYNCVISDGTLGNISIKTIGGFAALMKEEFVDGLKEHPVRKALAKYVLAPAAIAILGPIILPIMRKYDPSRANGAALLVPKVFIKGHGESDKNGIFRGLEAALEHAKNDVPAKMEKELEKWLSVILTGLPSSTEA